MRGKFTRCKPPQQFPCGCKDRASNATGGISMDSLLLKDGSKVCRCGRRWVVVWEEVVKMTIAERIYGSAAP